MEITDQEERERALAESIFVVRTALEVLRGQIQVPAADRRDYRGMMERHIGRLNELLPDFLAEVG